MTIVTTLNEVNNLKSYLPLAIAFVEDLKSVPGCLEMNVAIPEASETSLLFISKWESKDAWVKHIGGEIFNKHIPGMSPYYVSGIDSFFDVVE